MGLSARQERLLKALIEADDIGLTNGEEPPQRAFQNITRAMTALGFQDFVLIGRGAPLEIEELRELQSLLFRKTDIATGAMHFGAFMFRDLFLRFSVPVVFGSCSLEPLKYTDFSESQLRWLCSHDHELHSYEDQYFDVTDIAFGVPELGTTKPVPELTKGLLSLAQFNLEAAAGTLCRAYGYGGATQSALLSIELALKGGISAHGASESDLKDKYGHKLSELATDLSKLESSFDVKRVQSVIAKMPAYVPNRYDPEQPSRVASGHIVMGAQYICSEVIRQIGSRDIRVDANIVRARTYPSLI